MEFNPEGVVTDAYVFIDRVGIDLSQPFTRDQLADLLAGFAGKLLAEAKRTSRERIVNFRRETSP